MFIHVYIVNELYINGNSAISGNGNQCDYLKSKKKRKRNDLYEYVSQANSLEKKFSLLTTGKDNWNWVVYARLNKRKELFMTV